MSEQTETPPPWDIAQARNLYNIQRWGAKYFDINDAGHVIATPQQENGASVDLTDVIEEAKGRGLRFPLLVRFQDILRHPGIQLSGRLSRRVPDQSQPTARSR
jgi:arginine decarboxylase